MTPEQIQAEEAKQLLENPRFKQAFENVREKIVSQLEYCPIDNDIYRNQLVLSLQLLIQVREDIQDDINSGLLSE